MKTDSSEEHGRFYRQVHLKCFAIRAVRKALRKRFPTAKNCLRQLQLFRNRLLFDEAPVDYVSIAAAANALGCLFTTAPRCRSA